MRQRRRRIAAAVGTVVLIGAGGFGLRHWDETARRQACIEATAQALDEVWNPAAHQSLHDGLLASGVGYAEMTADKVAMYVDEQADALRDAQTQACLDTRVRAVWSEALLERASWCFEERRMQLQALVEELSHADRTSVENAVVAASQLSPVGPCRDRARLERGSAPPDDRDAAQAFHRAVSKAMALKSAGKYDEGLRVVRQAIDEYESLGAPGMIASARVALGGLLVHKGELEMAEEALVEAYFDAVRAGERDVSAEAALDLAYLLGNYLARRPEAERWYQHSIVALDELGEPEGSLRRARALRYLGIARQAAGAYEEAEDLFERVLAMHDEVLGPDHLRQARVLDSLAILHQEMGQLEEAKAINERVLGIKERTLGSGHPLVADSLVNLANVHQTMGHFDEARALGLRALAIREQTVGPDHAGVAVVLNNLANIAQETGDYARAKELHERALPILETKLGPEHPHVATSLNNLGNVASSMGAHDDARQLHERALQIREGTLGPEHRDVAMSLNNLANAQENLGNLEDAKASHERALRIWERVLGPVHADVALSLDNLADVHGLMGDHEQARTLHERALVIWEKTVGPSHPRLAYALVPLAQLALRDGRFGDAVSLAERAVEVCASPDLPVDLYAQSRYVLARALWAAPQGEGRDRARALEVAHQARDVLRDTSTEGETLAVVTDWIARHPQ